MARKSFSIHSDFYDELRNLTDEQRGAVLLALINLSSDYEIPKLDPVSAILFRLMSAQAERISSQNALNGQKGGAPTGNQNANKTTETSETKKNKRNKPTVSNTVTDTVSDTVTKGSASCAELSANADTPHRKIIFSLPLNNKTEYPIYEEQTQEWAALYPAVDVIQQLRSMRGWLDAKPKRRKTKSGIRTFINGWLAREQDKGHSQPLPLSACGNLFRDLASERGIFYDEQRNAAGDEYSQNGISAVLP